MKDKVLQRFSTMTTCTAQTHTICFLPCQAAGLAQAAEASSVREIAQMSGGSWPPH